MQERSGWVAVTVAVVAIGGVAGTLVFRDLHGLDEKQRRQLDMSIEEIIDQHNIAKRDQDREMAHDAKSTPVASTDQTAAKNDSVPVVTSSLQQSPIQHSSLKNDDKVELNNNSSRGNNNSSRGDESPVQAARLPDRVSGNVKDDSGDAKDDQVKTSSDARAVPIPRFRDRKSLRALHRASSRSHSRRAWLLPPAFETLPVMTGSMLLGLRNF